MSLLSRRRFMGLAALSAAVQSPSVRLSHAAETRLRETAAPARRRMRITEIEVHQAPMRFQDFNATTLFRYHGLAFVYRTFYIVKTDVGLEGYGESIGPAGPDADRFQKYVGTDPFDWIGETENLPINMAVYDLMGKYLGLPAWKLLGQKVRSWMPVAAWTVSQPPEAMAAELERAAGLGYRWLKYHVGEIQNVVDQTAAMQRVAPPGFRVHYDFNANSHYEAVFPVLKELERFPVAARVEDPILPEDHDGYRRLLRECSLSILLHHAPGEVMIERLCDGYMAGHAPVGSAAKLAAIAEATNTPIMFQNSGGTINQAFQAHETAVFKMAVLDHVNVVHLWKDDVTAETMPVVSGSVRVPDGPGLGVTLDREKLEQCKQNPIPKQTRFLVRVRYATGLTIYARHDPDQPGAVDNLRYVDRAFGAAVPGPAPGYGNPVVSDFWDEEGTAEFERIWKQTEAGPAWEEKG